MSAVIEIINFHIISLNPTVLMLYGYSPAVREVRQEQSRSVWRAEEEA